MMNSHVDIRFINMIQAGLNYWLQSSSSLTDEKIKTVEFEQKNITKLLKFGLGHAQTLTTTITLLLQLFDFVERCSATEKWLILYEKALEKFPPENELKTKLRLTIRVGQLYHLTNQQPLAEKILQAAYQEAVQVNDIEILGQIYCGLCVTYKSKQIFEQAEKYCRSALNLIDSPEQLPKIQALANQLLGMVLHHQGKTKEAVEHLELSKQIWEEFNEPLKLTRTLNDLAHVYISMKEYDSADRLFEQSLNYLSATNNQLDLSIIHINRGHLYFRNGHLEKAENEFISANSEYLKNSPHAHYKALIANNLGATLFEQGKYKEAEPFYQDAIKLRRIMNTKLSLTNCLLNFSELLIKLNKKEKVCVFLKEIIQLINEENFGVQEKKLRQNYQILLTQSKC